MSLSFEALVEDYDAARPGYPPALYDALPPLAGRDVLEIGAGTGKQLPGLVDRGARVVSTDPGPRMLGRLARSHPGAAVAVARAEALPFGNSSFDGVCGAQMWHWVDVPAAAAEAVRVLRPGGWLAVWWNYHDPLDHDPHANDPHDHDPHANDPNDPHDPHDHAGPGQDWFASRQDRLEALVPGYTRGYRTRPYGAQLEATGLFTSVTPWTGRWDQVTDPDTEERFLRSTSYVAALPAAEREGFLSADRRALAAAFPTGRIVKSHVVRLWVARRP